MSEPVSRRSILRAGLGIATAILGRAPAPAAAMARPPRSLALRNLHTGERLEAVYWVDGRPVPEALARIDWVLRDHRTGQVREIDRRLLDLLVALRRSLGSRAPFEVISGYRSPATNGWLARTTGGVARRSLHVEGRAVDIRVPDRSIEAVRDVARSLGSGGVGYYPRSGFVHLDVGPVRSW